MPDTITQARPDVLLPGAFAFTKAQTAELLNCSLRTIDNLIARRQLRSFKIGTGGVRVSRDAIESFIQSEENQKR